MSIQRSFIWLVAFASYGTLAYVTWGWFTGTPIGVTGIGFYFAIFFGAPCLVGHAGHLWRKNLLLGTTRFEAAICAIFPIAVLSFGAIAMLVNR
ncbi:hypothetical protein J2W24_004627 [Variovorax boronicumulans]|uniref:hypothetical protein n=1 Tax=Variovorax boronicumulans TaxID=436515 RepID=UPI00277DDADF|nr:hypothetical protein [Variovorax boronicumulans]MDP9918958.1 hypothetical protein [Variovorax boronicumulans]